MKKFRNFTPHPVVVYDESGEEIILSLPSIGNARVVEDCQHVEPVNGIPVVTKRYCGIEGLPECDPDCIDIVSLIVLQSTSGAGGRMNLVCPDTGPDSVVRDGGKILGVRRFQSA